MSFLLPLLYKFRNNATISIIISFLKENNGEIYFFQLEFPQK